MKSNNADNVSRETSKKANQNRRDIRKQQEMAEFRRKGNIADKNPDELVNPSLKELYVSFRSNSLTVVESLFNALYLWCNDNYYSSGVDVKDKYKNIYAHPSSWFANTSHMWKHNKWSIAVRIMEIVPLCSRVSQKLKIKKKNADERLLKAFEYSHRSSRKALTMLVTIAAFAGTAALITAWTVEARELKKIPALKVYIDKEYIGDVENISNVKDAKFSLEQSLSINFGTSYKLKCDIDYEPTTSDKGSLLTQAKLGKALSETAHKDMAFGYGLYAYDLLIAVSPTKAWLDDSMEKSLGAKLSYQQKNDSSIEKVSYYSFIVREGNFPEEMFMTKDEIRNLFSLDSQGEQTQDTANEGYLNISSKSTLLAGTSAGTSTDTFDEQAQDADHKISIETVITKSKTVTESIPYSTEYIYDDELAENRSEIVSKGKNGVKTAVYLIDYVENRELSRHLLTQNVVIEPVNEVIKQGRRPLTDEERRVMSTGKYIFPSQGELSSKYGWRVLGSYNEFHKGLDIRSDKGLELVAADGGTVIQASDNKNGYGLCVMIEHDDGTITRYAHCSKLYVKEGQKVGQGDHIADMGRSGKATGIHLHFEIIKNGKTVNPLNYLEPR